MMKARTIVRSITWDHSEEGTDAELTDALMMSAALGYDDPRLAIREATRLGYTGTGYDRLQQYYMDYAGKDDFYDRTAFFNQHATAVEKFSIACI